jgi:hypothetical protein
MEVSDFDPPRLSWLPRAHALVHVGAAAVHTAAVCVFFALMYVVDFGGFPYAVSYAGLRNSDCRCHGGGGATPWDAGTDNCFDFGPEEGGTQLCNGNYNLLAFSVGWLVVAFEAITVVGHALTALLAFVSKGQLTDANLVRWSEYALSAPLLFQALLVSVGVYDVSSLVLGFAAMLTCMLAGVALDLPRLRGEPLAKYWWLTYLLACVPYAAAWVVVAVRFVPVADDAPAFVSVLIGAVFVSYSLFPLHAVLNWAGVYARLVALALPAAAEPLLPALVDWGYVLLSLSAKLTAAVILFSGVFMETT